MLKLKLQYFRHLMQRADSLEKSLVLWKIEGRKRRGQQDEMVGWHHRLYGHEFELAPGVGDGTGKPGMLQFMGSQRVRHDWATELNWTVTQPSYLGGYPSKHSYFWGTEVVLWWSIYLVFWQPILSERWDTDVRGDISFPYPSVHYSTILQQLGHGSHLDVHWQMNG